MKRILFVCVTVWALCSCSPKVTTNIIHKHKPVEYVEDVVILKEKEPLPADADWMGDIEVKGKANYNRMAEITRFKAWEQGANYVRVKSFGSDGVRSDIHVMTSDVYRADTAHHVAVPIANTTSKNTSSYLVTGTNQAYNNGVGNLNVELDPKFAGPHGVRLFVGYGRRLNRLNPSMNAAEKMHFGRLLNGAVFGADYVYYFNSSRKNGFGLRYQIMNSSSSDYGRMDFENGTSAEGVLKDIVNISYIGPIYSVRNASNNGKNFVVFDAGLGLLRYGMKESINKMESNVTGWTSGLTLDLNYCHFLSENLSMGIDLSLTSGTLTSYSISEGGVTQTVNLEQSNWEGLLHMCICAQLVYTF